MTERETMPRLPTSGQIIGVLVAKLGVKHPVLQSRTARRYFSADPEQLVKDSTKENIIGAIAEALTDYGFIATPQASEGNYESVPMLASTIQWHADNWDLFRSFLRRRTMRVLPGHLPKVWEAYVRLAAIDLALRLAAHLHIAQASPDALEFLKWASVGRRGEYLNRKRSESGVSLSDFAESVGVSDNTVEAWLYHGARPSDDNLGKIAKALADRIEGSDTSGVERELRGLYWVSDVAGLLAEYIGNEAVEDAVSRMHRYAGATFRIIEDQFPVEDRAADLAVLADLGAGARLAEPLLAGLLEDEQDAEWQEDLRSTGMDWVRRVLSANLRAHFAGVDDLIQETNGRLLEDWDVSNPDAFAHYRRSLELRMQGRLHEALAEVEMAARLDPLDPVYHFTLGSVKTGIGIGRYDTALVSKGLNALWLAVALDPKWILPWNEIGLTLLHTDRAEEAVRHLRDVKPECGPLDSGYYSALGAAFWKLNRLFEALGAFEAALELDPEETANLVAASEIALLTGNTEKHRQYSRRSHHFGADEGTDRFMELLREFGKEEKRKRKMLA